MTNHDSETLAEGKQVFTAVAFIHNEVNGVHKVFVAKRAATKKFLPGAYELPGGHVDFGEDMVVGLKREMMEEFGVEIDVGDPFFVFTYKNDIKQSHSIEVMYFARFKDPSATITVNPDDHSEWAWLSENELDVVANSKVQGDPEVRGITKGFALLRGESMNVG